MTRTTKAQEIKKFPSELRFDLVSEDWVVIATGRARRPKTFQQEKRKSLFQSKKTCPFESLDRQEFPALVFFQGKQTALSTDKEYPFVPVKWTTVSIPNKYPAFSSFSNFSPRTRLLGPYQVMDGVGFHEVIITKDHKKDIPQFTKEQTQELIEVYHSRFVYLKNKDYVRYISIFKNKGVKAGATVAHPHSQLIATPITDPDIERSLAGSLEYFQTHRQCVHCTMLQWDRRDKKRIVYENDCYTVVCPFASRVAFEIRIYPKEHLSYFERINRAEKECLAEAFLVTMKKLYKALKDPDYNYFLHTAPTNGNSYDHFHWHWEILPRTSAWAGFELGTGIEISTIEPEKAAAFLRRQT